VDHLLLRTALPLSLSRWGQQTQVGQAHWGVQLHGERGETGTHQTGCEGPVRDSPMVGLVQAGYETSRGRVASFMKSLALLFFASSPTPIFVPIPSLIFLTFWLKEYIGNAERCIGGRPQLNCSRCARSGLAVWRSKACLSIWEKAPMCLAMHVAGCHSY